MNSIWLSEKKQNNQYNQLAEDKTTDVCIIGAGIFGITCGYYLAKAGLKVTIIEKDEMGKPFFQKHIDYDLSISHTDGLVAVAVGKNHKIGIDVEKIHKVSTTIINKYYSKSEKKALSRNRVNTELIETKIWTMKEAYSKCLGTGLNRDLLMWDTYSRKGIVMETQIYKEYVITVCRMIESM